MSQLLVGVIAKTWHISHFYNFKTVNPKPTYPIKGKYDLLQSQLWGWPKVNKKQDKITRGFLIEFKHLFLTRQKKNGSSDNFHPSVGLHRFNNICRLGRWIQADWSLQPSAFVFRTEMSEDRKVRRMFHLLSRKGQSSRVSGRWSSRLRRHLEMHSTVEL